MIVTLYTIFAVIHLTSSITVDIPLQTYEFARGGNGTIPCNFKPKSGNPPTNMFVVWSAHPDNPDDSDIDILTYYHSASPTLDISSDYSTRATFQVDITKGWVNLTLNALTSADTRVFQCEVKIPNDSTGKPSDTASVVVLVAPSKPICAVQGKAEFYQNISLTCRSEEGTPLPTYNWQSYDVSNKLRPNPAKSTDLNGVLSLYNISADTSGYYICSSTNKVGSNSCNLTLAVMPYSMNLGSTAGIIGGVAVAVLLLILIVCCCYCRRRKKDKAEEYTMGSQEEGEYRDNEPREVKEHQVKNIESKADGYDDHEERSNRTDDRREQDDRQGRPNNRQYDSDRYDDRQSDRHDDRRSDRHDDRRGDRYDDRRNDRYDDRRNDRYDDRRNDRYDDRRSDYDDRRSDYDDRRSDYDDRRSDYDDRRSDYDDRRSDRYDDRRRDRYDDRRDRYDHPDDRYNDRSRPPDVPLNKPTRG